MPAHLISVVMPTRNRPALLERAARSVLDQGAAGIELIVVDDASSDDTPQVLDRLASDVRVQVVHNSESLGPGGSRNRGIAAARGDLLSFCDDDDAWLPGAATTVLDSFTEHPEVGVVTAWHRVVHEPGGRTAVFRGPLRYGADQLRWFDFIALPFGVIRRELFEPDLGVDPDLPSCEDWDLWLRCAERRPIRTLPAVLYAYHQHAGSRVTRVGSAFVEGRRRFLAKHSESMSASCRLYHDLVVAQLDGGREAVARRLAGAGGMPIAAAAAASVLGVGGAASTLARRRRDPGLPARLTAALLGAGRMPR
jgi:glycosyltransferase involved in cell wall biosynthesis